MCAATKRCWKYEKRGHGRRRRKSDVVRSTRRREFTGSNWRALKKNNSRSSDVSGQSESALTSWQPANEEADIQADKAISSIDVPKEWQDWTNQEVFTWQEPRRKVDTVSNEDRKSMWNSGVRKAIRRGSAEEEVRKHRNRVTGAWKQISKQRRRVVVSYDPSMVTALRHGTWMDGERLKKTCINEKGKRGGIHQPFHGTWAADFMLRKKQGSLCWENTWVTNKFHWGKGDV